MVRISLITEMQFAGRIPIADLFDSLLRRLLRSIADQLKLCSELASAFKSLGFVSDISFHKYYKTRSGTSSSDKIPITSIFSGDQLQGRDTTIGFRFLRNLVGVLYSHTWGLGASPGLGARGSKARWDKGDSRLRVGSKNIETLQGKSIELVKILKKRRVSIACVQETKWVGTKARDVDGYKLWYSGSVRHKNGVGILVDEDLKEHVMEFKRVGDRLMSIKLVIGGSSVNVISTYAPQVGLDEEEKKGFWEVLDEAVRGVPSIEKLFVGGDFNGHIGSLSRGYDDVHVVSILGRGIKVELLFWIFLGLLGCG
ncbi:hypothetical protein FXO37_19693 [Capsicum annuum]|nr:hypothetical protein FXO37_19693 [Capsicum annuum]